MQFSDSSDPVKGSSKLKRSLGLCRSLSKLGSWARHMLQRVTECSSNPAAALPFRLLFLEHNPNTYSENYFHQFLQ